MLPDPGASMTRSLLKWFLVLAGLGLPAALLPLSGDEAYYWECGQNLDWSYFDQPPLVIWMARGFTEILGNTALAVRAPALVFTGLTGLLLWAWLGEAGLGLFLGLRLLPIVFFGSFYLSTDAGLVFFYLLSTYAFVRIREASRWRWWLLLGAAGGLGFLAKFPIVLAGFLLLFIPWRGVRLAPVLAAAALASALTAPVWVYALRHDWANIVFQLVGRHPRLHTLAGDLAGYWLPQFAFVGPLLLPLGAAAVWRARRDDRLLLAAGLIPAAFFGLLAFRSPMAPHWALPGLIPLAVLARPRLDRRWLRAALAVNALLIAFLLTLVVVPHPFIPLAPKAAGNLLGPDRLWEVLVRTRQPGETLATESYSTAALMNFRSGRTGTVLLANADRGVHGLSYLYWQEGLALAGRDVLFVTAKPAVLRTLPLRFERVESVVELPVREWERTIRTYYIARCRGLRDEGMFKP
jgi:4-amino-4-deoxy-L-arabinose transferase-like glycosyltransferase